MTTIMPSCIRTDVPLAPYTTLGVGGPAQFFVEVENIAMLHEVTEWAQAEGLPITILGGGSNVLVSEEGVRGVVIRYTAHQITFEKNKDTTRVTADAGVMLDALIETVVAKELWGLENLSHIPGSVGAVPVQNVGAYGVEGKDVVDSVTVYDLSTHTVRVLTNTACQFAYRDSIFKHEEGAALVIVSVVFTVHAKRAPRLTYKDITEYFGSHTEPTLREIRDAIIAIRTAKLPDWHTVGTAGSFFKNPIVTKETYERLHTQYPELPGFPETDGPVKISLGWVLDKVSGIKEYREGNVGLYEKQALVLTCTNEATAREVNSFVAESSHACVSTRRLLLSLKYECFKKKVCVKIFLQNIFTKKI